MNRIAASATALLLFTMLAGASLAEAKTPALPPPQAPTKPGQLTPDTTVKLSLLETLTTRRAEKGDRVNFSVAEDVIDPAGAVLIRKGTPAYGTVTRCHKNGMFGKAGALDVALDYTTAVDGQKVSLRGTQDQKGKSRVGGTIALTLLVAWPLMFLHGGNVTYDAGTQLMGWVDQTVTVGAAATAAASSGADPAPTTAGK